MGSYVRFFAMIGTSTFIMWVLMYLNTYNTDHLFYSETRLYMAFVMGAAMAVIMLSYMLHMYSNKVVNATIYLVSIIVFAGALWLVRSQVTVQDVSWMKAMIPHHSIAILTSERAQISDPRVRELAEAIIKTQREEIALMEKYIRDLEGE